MFSRLGASIGRAARTASARSFSTAAAVLPIARTRVFGALAAGVAASAVVLAASQHETPVACAGKVPLEGVAGTNLERTFIAIKPDGVQRGLISEIIGRFEKKGFKLVGLKMLTPTKQQAEGHYDDLKTKPFFKGLTTFFSSGPIVAMVWEGKGSILTGRRLLGETDPAKSPPGSIRGDFSIEMGRNIIHGSDGPEGAAHEINFWFKEGELNEWSTSNAVHIYEKP